MKLPTELPKTKIVATIGPATWDDDILLKMIDAGMTVARINASFADHEELERVSGQIQGLSSRVALMLDTQGHKIRVNKLEKPVQLNKGGMLELGVKKNAGAIWVEYPDLVKDVSAGERILLDDGNITLSVKEIKAESLLCEIVQGGELRPLKTVYFPDTHLSFPALTEKDHEDIKYAVENKFDFISASFIRSVEDVDAIQKYTDGTVTKVIAKIENAEGIENFDTILREVDGIMVARGDLGVEMAAEKVPILQKQMIRKCREIGKPVIVATQMLESMRENSRPTRAEVSDVANAVMDGADAVMLSAETSTGEHPVEAVEWMARSCREAEDACESEILFGSTDACVETDAVARYIVDLAHELPVDMIVAGSKSGRTALSIARHRPEVGVIVFVNSATLMRQLNVVRGVYPIFVKDEFPADRDWLVRVMADYCLKEKLLKQEDMVVLVTGSGIAGKSRNTIVEVARVFDVMG